MRFCFQKYLCYIFHRARTFLTNITFEMYNNHNIILEGPSVSVMTIVQCLSVSVTAPKRRQRGGLGTPGHLRPTTWAPLKPVTSGGRRTSSAGVTLSEKNILQIHFQTFHLGTTKTCSIMFLCSSSLTPVSPVSPVIAFLL